MSADLELITDCLNKKPEAWKTLVQRFSRAVYGTILQTLAKYGLGSRRDLADDIYQQVFIDLWEKERFKRLREPSLLKPYMVAITVSRAVDAVRLYGKVTQPLERMDADAELPADGDHPAWVAQPVQAQKLLSDEIGAQMKRELKALSHKEVTVLKLALEQGLSHRQIGELLSMPVDSVSTLVRRTKEKIRTALQKQGFNQV